jgi:hypothetical protein
VDLVRTDDSEEPVTCTTVLQLLVTANAVPNPPIIFALRMVAIRFSETAVLRRLTRRHVIVIVTAVKTSNLTPSHGS